MAASGRDYYGASEVIPTLQPFQSMESLAEWRSSEQVQNCIPSTSPPYWDTDDNHFGPKPSELFGRYTWNIDKFSENSKKELRSNQFSVGGHKWYILIYPKGCDVCNHLSLFLCVANHDKLSPGWSHFAQFTISVVNKDPKKSKYSDTLHRFWKKEHDWGWKKFMESTKVTEGFLVSDTLVIKAQVQVIREKADRPFLCLDRQYRGELVRVYLTNVEQICRRFFEEKRAKLLKLIEDKARWSSFREFWLSTDDKSRHNMYREKTDTILKVVVKHFFVEKEVTSTLVMDSLYSGLKALEFESRSKNGKSKSLETEETSAPIVRLEEDMFVLVDDVLGLLQRVALESRPPKDEKGPQNRTKDGNSGEDVKKDAMEPDERRLTELGRRTIEIFVLGHIFSNKILAAFEEAVALKMQEELIREEEEAGKAEYGQKAKRAAIEKEKRVKRKQGKHKRKNRKAKNKGKGDKFSITIEDKQQGYHQTDDVTSEFTAAKLVQKPSTLDDASDVSDTGDDISETIQLESEDRDTSTVNWDTDTSEVPLSDTTGSGISCVPVQNGRAEKNMYSMEDSSSTCSTESAPSVVMNCSHKGNKTGTLPRRGKCHCGKETKDHAAIRAHEFDNQPSEPVVEAACQYDSFQDSRDTGTQSETVLALKGQIKCLHRHLNDKEVVTMQHNIDVKGQVDVKRPSKQYSEAEASSFSRSPRSPRKTLPSTVKSKVVADQTVLAERASVVKKSSNSHQRIKKVTPIRTSSSQVLSLPKSTVQNSSSHSKSLTEPAVPMSRPSSAPLVPPRQCVPVISTAQTTPSLARSMSAAGRLANGSQSYKNAIMGNNTDVASLGSNPSLRNSSVISSQPFNMSSSPLISAQISHSGGSGFTFGSVSQDVFQSRPPWLGDTSDSGTSSTICDSSILSKIQNIDIHDRTNTGSSTYFSKGLPPRVSSPQTQGTSSVEDFPHLDMINHLLDEEQSMGRAVETEAVFHNPNNAYHHPLNQQFTFQDDIAMQEDAGSLINYGMYDQPSNYYDAVHHAYGIPFDALPQAGSSAYENEYLNGVLQNQWEMSADQFSLLNGWTIDDDGYQFQYQVPEYANLNGYNMYLSSNGL